MYSLYFENDAASEVLLPDLNLWPAKKTHRRTISLLSKGRCQYRPARFMLNSGCWFSDAGPKRIVVSARHTRCDLSSTVVQTQETLVLFAPSKTFCDCGRFFRCIASISIFMIRSCSDIFLGCSTKTDFLGAARGLEDLLLEKTFFGLLLAPPKDIDTFGLLVVSSGLGGVGSFEDSCASLGGVVDGAGADFGAPKLNFTFSPSFL